MPPTRCFFLYSSFFFFSFLKSCIPCKQESCTGCWSRYLPLASRLRTLLFAHWCQHIPPQQAPTSLSRKRDRQTETERELWRENMNHASSFSWRRCWCWRKCRRGESRCVVKIDAIREFRFQKEEEEEEGLLLLSSQKSCKSIAIIIMIVVARKRNSRNESSGSLFFCFLFSVFWSVCCEKRRGFRKVSRDLRSTPVAAAAAAPPLNAEKVWTQTRGF